MGCCSWRLTAQEVIVLMTFTYLNRTLGTGCGAKMRNEPASRGLSIWSETIFVLTFQSSHITFVRNDICSNVPMLRHFFCSNYFCSFAIMLRHYFCSKRYLFFNALIFRHYFCSNYFCSNAIMLRYYFCSDYLGTTIFLFLLFP
jgi:hypothetical protein